MKIIVSTTIPDNFREFKVIQSLVNLKEIDVSMIINDFIIIHSFIETEFQAGLILSQLRQRGINKFVYINKEPFSMVSMLFKDENSRIYNDEFYLEDEEELLALLDDITEEEEEKEKNAIVGLSSIDVICDFVDKFSQGKNREISMPIYISRVKEAILELSVLTEQQNTELMNLGNNIEEIFLQASDVMKNIDNNRKVLQQKLDALEQEINKSSMNTGSFFNNEITFFNPYKVFKNTSKVLLIKEYGSCKCLTSFLISFCHWLKYEKNYRIKLIIGGQKSFVENQKYQNCEFFNVIMQDTMNYKSLYTGDFIYTSYLQKNVLKELIDEQPSDIIIFVDRTKGKLNMLDGRVKILYAINSLFELEYFNLNKSKTITSCISGTEVDDFFYNIPIIKNFNELQSDAKIAAYSQISNSVFQKLLNFINS